MPRPVGFTPEDEGAKKKWDAWKREQGLSKTEAKRRYIQYLIETMKIYASGTQETRELLNELEYLWEQIKNLPWEDIDTNIEYPPSPSISDRYSVTPINQNYRNSLQKIYSRRSTMDVNSNQNLINHGPPSITGNLNQSHIPPSLTGTARQTGPPSIHSLPERKQNKISNLSIDEFKSWQSEINSIVSKLAREKNNGVTNNINQYGNKSPSDEELDPNIILKRRIIKILRTLGINALQFLKTFSVSCLALLFFVWCIKKNVKVEKTYMKEKGGKQELLVNMVVNANESKWFIRMLKFIDAFVGFTK